MTRSRARMRLPKPTVHGDARTRRWGWWLAVLLALGAAGAARAQVTVDLKALDALPDRPPVARAPRHRPSTAPGRAPVHAERTRALPKTAAQAGPAASPPAGHPSVPLAAARPPV
ncbi:MAG: hypothetical protein KGL52_17510, partial [Rhodospirillales bacterium]|nr:hypothetical protein [Rhodospirillales bacterium]